jgi:hypothetical protein
MPWLPAIYQRKSVAFPYPLHIAIVAHQGPKVAAAINGVDCVPDMVDVNAPAEVVDPCTPRWPFVVVSTWL